MRAYLPNKHAVSFLLIYALVVLYTLTFPSTVTWFAFYAFTFVLVAAFLSARFHAVFKQIKTEVHSDGTLSLLFNVVRRFRLLFLVPVIQATLLSEGEPYSQQISAYFKRKLSVHFSDLKLPRGHHDKLKVELKGSGLLGIFNHRSMHSLPVDLDVYPKRLSKSAIHGLMHNRQLGLINRRFVAQHEYQVKEIRKYQSRDSLSHIDWKSSLKRDNWMIKEYETEEQKPLSLYFAGIDSPNFESLLSLAYSLYQELSATHPVTLNLCGSFNGEIKVKQTHQDFLSIQPCSEKHLLAEQINSRLLTSETILIIYPKTDPISDLLNNSTTIIPLTEDHLPAAEGEKAYAV